MPCAAAPTVKLSATVNELQAAAVNVIKRRRPHLDPNQVAGITTASGALLDGQSHVLALWNTASDTQRFELMLLDAE